MQADNRRAGKDDTFMLLNRDLHSASQTCMSRCVDAVIQSIATHSSHAQIPHFALVFAGFGNSVLLPVGSIFAFCLLQNYGTSCHLK